MKKKILAIIVSALLLMSTLATTASADGFADINVGFSTMPDGLEGVDGITIQSNKALNILLNGKAGNTDADRTGAVAAVWGYKGWIHLSDEMITYDSTVTFWVKRTGFVDGSTHGMPMALSDSINRVANAGVLEGENLGGTIIGTGNRDRTISVYPNTDGAYAAPVVTTATIQDDTWVRMDYVVDFTAKKTQIYADCQLIGESEFSANALGYKGIKTCLFSSGNFDIDYYVDEIVIREGKIAPTTTDVCGKKDRDAIEADTTVKIYEPFDAKNANTMSNTSSYPWSIVEVDAFNQSTMQMVVPHADTAFEAYMKLSDTALKGNATVSFKVKNDYTVKKLPGLEIKLADANKKVLGGIVINKDGGFCYDDGTNIYYATDADGNNIMTKSGQWYTVDMLVNYTNHSITVYLDGTRLGTVAMEASDMDGFTGILFSKVSNDGAKAQTFSFDNLSVITGLYAPGAGSSLSDSDPLVTIDTQYSDDKSAGGAEDNKDGEETTADTTADDTAADTEADDTSADTEEEKGGCGSSVMAGTAVLALAAAGVALVSKKRKEN